MKVLKLRCRKFLGCLLKDTCFNWDKDQSLGWRSRKLVFCVPSSLVTQAERQHVI